MKNKTGVPGVPDIWIAIFHKSPVVHQPDHMVLCLSNKQRSYWRVHMIPFPMVCQFKYPPIKIVKDQTQKKHRPHSTYEFPTTWRLHRIHARKKIVRQTIHHINPKKPYYIFALFRIPSSLENTKDKKKWKQIQTKFTIVECFGCFARIASVLVEIIRFLVIILDDIIGPRFIIFIIPVVPAIITIIFWGIVIGNVRLL